MSEKRADRKLPEDNQTVEVKQGQNWIRAFVFRGIWYRQKIGCAWSPHDVLRVSRWRDIDPEVKREK